MAQNRSLDEGHLHQLRCRCSLGRSIALGSPASIRVLQPSVADFEELRATHDQSHQSIGLCGQERVERNDTWPGYGGDNSGPMEVGSESRWRGRLSGDGSACWTDAGLDSRVVEWDPSTVCVCRSAHAVGISVYRLSIQAGRKLRTYK